MKKNNIYLAMALLALAGCGKEPVPADGDAITVEASVGAATKVSADGASFIAGDRIAVYAWLGGATENPTARVVDGVVNTFDGTKWTPASLMRWKVTDDPHYFLGVYPAPAASLADLTAVPYTLDPADYTASDLLLATTPAGVKNTSAAVPLEFHHAMAKLVVNLKFGAGWDATPSVSAVTVNAKTAAKVNCLAEAVTAMGAAAAVPLSSTSAAAGYALSYSGLQVPQDGVKKVVVAIDGRNFAYNASEAIPLRSGAYTTLNLTVNRTGIELGGVSIADWESEALAEADALPDMLSTPLTVEAAVAGAKVKFDILAEAASNPVLYRTWNGAAWSDWTEYTSGQDVELAQIGDKLQFKAKTTQTSYSVNYAKFSTISFSENCYVYGNIMSLINGSDFSTVTELTGKFAFNSLFQNNTHLLLNPVNRLLLPATTLSDSCYRGMFEGCTNLSFAPELPATTLGEACYYEMFRDCTSLVVAPKLPATSLIKYCYYRMFKGCTSLVDAPVLPAMTVAPASYASMFEDCTSLVVAPELPATKLLGPAYSDMFKGCTSLTVAPALPSTDGCYYASMFQDCVSLKEAPALPATNLEIECYSHMFYGCTSLVVAPELPATTLAVACYYGMFWDCTSLTEAPLLPARTLPSDCYRIMFSGCSKLKSVTCLATSFDASSLSNCVIGFLDGAGSEVSGTKTFKAPPHLDWESVYGGCPAGWTREYYYEKFDGREYIELGEVTVGGVKKNLKWAVCNLGALNSWDYGDVYAWGETAAKSNYSRDTYKWGNGTSISKYKGTDYVKLQADDDAAAAAWGLSWHSSWRMPTNEEWGALLDGNHFTWQWTTNYRGSGKNGMLVTRKDGPNAHCFIFLPAAGYGYSTTRLDCDTEGYYWSSSLDTNDIDSALPLNFSASGKDRNSVSRYCGLSVRPVSD